MHDEQQAGDLTGQCPPPHPLWDVQTRLVDGRTWIPLADVYKACGYQGGGGPSAGVERIEAFGRGTELQKISGVWWVDMDGLRLAAASMRKVDARDACAQYVRQVHNLDRDRIERAEKWATDPGLAAEAPDPSWDELVEVAFGLTALTRNAATRSLISGQDELAMAFRDLYLEQDMALAGFLAGPLPAAPAEPCTGEQPQSASDLGEGAPDGL